MRNRWKAYDTNGDGVPNYGKNPSGDVVKLTPSSMTGTLGSGGGGFGPSVQWGIRGMAPHDPAHQYVIYGHPPQVPLPFETRLNEAELLQQYGLDTLQVGINVGSIIEMNRFVPELDDEGDVVGGFLDVTLHWNGNFQWPVEIDQYPHLGYAFHNVSDNQDQIGAYWNLQIDGEIEYVLKWLADLGLEDAYLFGVTAELETGGTLEVGDITVQLDTEALTATFIQDFEVVAVLPLLQ